MPSRTRAVAAVLSRAPAPLLRRPRQSTARKPGRRRAASGCKTLAKTGTGFKTLAPACIHTTGPIIDAQHPIGCPVYNSFQEQGFQAALSELGLHQAPAPPTPSPRITLKSYKGTMARVVELEVIKGLPVSPVRPVAVDKPPPPAPIDDAKPPPLLLKRGCSPRPPPRSTSARSYPRGA